MKTILFTISSLAVANFICYLLGSTTGSNAFERTFYELFAMLIYGLNLRVFK
jgi:hypothetical protein